MLYLHFSVFRLYVNKSNVLLNFEVGRGHFNMVFIRVYMFKAQIDGFLGRFCVLLLKSQLR